MSAGVLSSPRGGDRADRARATWRPRSFLRVPRAHRPRRRRIGAFLWTAERRPRRTGRRRWGGAARGQGPVLHRGRSDHGRLAHPRGHRPLYTATAVRRLAGGGRADARQDQHGRVRDGLVERELGFGSCATRGTASACRAVERRLGGGGRGRPRAVGDRHRHRRLDPPARGAVRHRRAEADLRRGLALRHGRVRVLARPVRPAHAHGHRRGAAARADRRRDPLRLDLARPCREDVRLPAAPTCAACASACPRS